MFSLSIADVEHVPEVCAFYRTHAPADFPHPALFDEERLAHLVRAGDLGVMMARGRRELVGCGLGVPYSWNRSFKVGRLTVPESDSKVVIEQTLFEGLLHLGWEQFGIVHYVAEDEFGFRRATKAGLACWGFAPPPMRHDFHGTTLLMGAFNEQIEPQRVTPPHNAVTGLEFCAKIINAHPNSTSFSEHPAVFPVGEQRGAGVPVVSGRVWPVYDSKRNVMRIERVAGPYPVETLRQFVNKLRQDKGVRDIRLRIPASNEAAIAALWGMRFRITSYWPGWFIHGNHRHDCVELIGGVPNPARERASTFVERVAHKILDTTALM